MTRRGLLFPAMVLLAGLAVSVTAQNARVNALAGCDLVMDISRILYNPAFMNNYKNDAQVTFGGGTILGVKSLGAGAFSMGAMLNRGPMLKGFFAAGTSALQGIALPPATTPTLTTSDIQYYPHLLFGFDFSTVQIGLDAYVEWVRTIYKYTSDATAITPAVEVEQKLNAMHPGLIAGFKINLNSASIVLHAGGGMPDVTGTVNRVNSAPAGESKVTTQSGLFGRGGVQVALTAGTVDLIFGADARYEKFQFSTYIAGSPANIDGDMYTDQTFTPHFGIQTRLPGGVLFIAQERSSLTFVTDDNDPGTVLGDYDTLRHTLATGLEKQFPKVWRLDSCALRGGVTWSAVNRYQSAKTTNAPATTTDHEFVTTVGPAFPFLGMGVSKGFFTVDLLLNAGTWNGALIGPQVSQCTVSLMF